MSARQAARLARTAVLLAATAVAAWGLAVGMWHDNRGPLIAAYVAIAIIGAVIWPTVKKNFPKENQ